MFTYVASASPRGNENIRRVCSHWLGRLLRHFQRAELPLPALQLAVRLIAHGTDAMRLGRGSVPVADR